MENERILYNVYVRIDGEGCIIDINSDAFLYPTSLWVKIDSGYDDRCHYAETNYFPKPIMDERGIKRYKAYPFVDAPEGEIIKRFFKDGVEYVILERTQEEMDADYAARPVSPPSDKERIAALEDALTAIEEGIASV